MLEISNVSYTDNTMRLYKDEIAASPKLIFSFDMNVQLRREELLDLLKKDVLVEELNDLDRYLEKLKKIVDPYTAIIVNLDNTFREIRSNHRALKIFSLDLIQRINTVNPGRTLVITSYIYPEVAHLFRSEGIGYIEKRIFDQRDYQNTILNVVPPFFSERNRLIRNYLRINVSAQKILVKIQNIHDGLSWGPSLEGQLKDISLNGLSVIFKEKNHAECFVEGDNVYMEFHLQSLPVRIARSIVSRVLPEDHEVCVYYDLMNPSMINDLNATHISNFMYSFLHKIIELRKERL